MLNSNVRKRLHIYQGLVFLETKIFFSNRLFIRTGLLMNQLSLLEI